MAWLDAIDDEFADHQTIGWDQNHGYRSKSCPEKVRPFSFPSLYTMVALASGHADGGRQEHCYNYE